MASMAHAIAVDYTANLTSSATNLAVSTVGLISLMLSVFNFAPIDESLPGGYLTFRLGIAINQYEDMGAGGDHPDVRLWTEQGDFTGIYTAEGMKPKTGYLHDGEIGDLIIPQNNIYNDMPTYALLSANNNGICIAYVQIAGADGPDLAWVGNWGRTCQKEWYHSGIVIGGKALECTWIDKNGDHDTTGLQVHFPDFRYSGEGYDRDAEYLCTHPPSLSFRTEPDPKTVIFYTPGKRSSPPKRGSTLRARSEPAPVFTDQRLIKSNLTIHTASSLCESTTSRGPDFVSLPEGRFCDMETKKLWPICASPQEGDCFDNEAHDVRLVGSVGKRDGPVALMKNYTRVTHWE